MASSLVKLVTAAIDKFDGTADFDKWIREFDAMLDALRVSESADRYSALVLCLDQEVLTRVMSEVKEAGTLPKKQEEQDKEWLVGELVKRYSFDKTPLRRLLDAQDRECGRTETYESYALEKRRRYLAFAETMKADDAKTPGKSLSDKSRLFVEMLYDGLPKHVQPAVRTLHPLEQTINWDEFVKTLRSLQGRPRPSDDTTSLKPKSPKKDDKKSTPKKDASTKQYPPCAECGEYGHPTWRCPKKAKRAGGRNTNSKLSGSNQEREKEIKVLRAAT
jgi:hypothetical protein